MPLLLLPFLTLLPDLPEVLSGTVLEEEEVWAIGPVLLQGPHCGGAHLPPEHLLLTAPGRAGVLL